MQAATGWISRSEQSRQCFRRPPRRTEEEEKEVQSNEENPEIALRQCRTCDFLEQRVRTATAKQISWKRRPGSQDCDSRTCCKPSCRACHGRNPCDSQGQREIYGDDAREWGIDPKCSRRIDKKTKRRRRGVRRAGRRRADKRSRILSGGDVEKKFA